MSLAAGKLRQRIVVEQLTEEQDEASGNITETWSELATLWAEVRFVSGREFMAAGAEASQVVAMVRIRFRTDVTRRMRVRYLGRTFDIQQVLPDDQSGHEWLTLMVSEVTHD